MASPGKFANYPDPVEGPKTEYKPRVDHNPELRGFPLVIGASVIANSGIVARYLWHNARMGSIKHVPGLERLPYTFEPCVMPLGETGPMLEPTRELLASKYTDSQSRYHTISDYHDMYRAGKTTPLQVATTLLKLTMESAKYKDAWADYHGADRLVLEAAQASTERWLAGSPLGILDGVPIGVKDDTDVEGFINHVGMKYDAGLPFFDVKEESCWPVKKLQEAGAVVIGKNRMHEIGSDTNGLNITQGTPTNHHNNLYYPGGSSSGAASSLSVGVVPVAIATDSGGSIRIPCSFNGVYGLKPSHHRTMVMKHTTCVTGPMAATVSDLTIAYRVMSQPDPDCSVQGLFALSRPPGPSAKRVLGVHRDWFNLADAATKGACERALDWLVSQQGYEVVDIAIPYLSEAQMAHAGICMTEMAETARLRTPNPADWLSLVGAANRLFLSVGAQTPAADYLGYNAMRTLVMQHLAHLFRQHPGLLIITPTTPMNGWPRAPGDDSHGVSDTNRTLRNMAFIFLANLTGTPSLSAPVGYVDADQGEGKLPVGMLATGEWGSEEQLLAWAAEVEQYLHEDYPDGRRRPDAWADVLGMAAGEANQ